MRETLTKGPLQEKIENARHTNGTIHSKKTLRIHETLT